MGKVVSGEFKSPAEAQRAARNEILLNYEDTKEITIEVSKGIYSKLGDIIRIDVPDNNIEGKARITGRNINGSKSRFTCTLNCNKKPIKFSDYI